MSQLLLDTLHVVDLIGARIRSRSDRLIVLDAEVDTCDRVFARNDTDLMCRFVLESR